MANRDGFRGENDRAGAVSPYVNQRGVQHNGGEGVAGPVEPRLFINDPDFALYVGDVRDVLASLPDESVHCVVTSPPYWGLRDYGTGLWDGGNPGCDHLPENARRGVERRSSTLGSGVATITAQEGANAPREVCPRCGARRVDRQLGLEPTPDLYVENMVAVFREVRRVLRRDGTCWLNLGDSYASSGTFGNTDPAVSGLANGRSHHLGPKTTASKGRSPTPEGLKPKDLVGVPWRVAFALQADGWYLRADVIWSKPNPMPESVTDRPTKAHEYLFLLTKSPRYFYDADAVRETITGNAHSPGHGYVKSGHDPKVERGFSTPVLPSARNRRSVWEIATEPYPDAHFATFPQALVEPCVKAGTSERGCCPECGAPWERETEREPSDWQERRANGEPTRHGLTGAASHGAGGFRGLSAATTGWRPSCGHDLEPVPCTVLDPFMGSGTTALVARRLGRRSIGVELNETYAQLAARRLAQLSLLA